MTGGGHSDFDIIYIDPPYNTESAKTDGNVSANNNENISASKFIYRDKFSRNGWLNMMKERLIMARQLLKEDGVIFVSIDDNEQGYLKVLMDEIFGEENFVGCFPNISNLKGRQANTSVALTHEYLIIYRRKYFTFNKLDNKYATTFLPNVYKERTNEIKIDKLGEYICQNDLTNSNSSFNINTRPKLYYPIYYNIEDKSFLLEKKENYIEIFPSLVNNVQGVWRWQKDKVKNESYNLEIKINNNEYKIYTKNRDFSWIPKTLILGPKFNNKNGNDLLHSIIFTNNFSTAKPLELIKLILKLHINKNARVLDFFAGSGTTGHAVLELNREDGGSRTYTLVTNNENNIGSNITYERLYRINNGKGTKGEIDFKWLEKNDPYKQNLNVYSIEYFDASIDKRAKDESDDVSLKLLKKLDELLNSLNLKPTEINNEQKKLNILTELNALDKKETTNESK